MVSMLISIILNKSLTGWDLFILALSHMTTTLLFRFEYFLLSSEILFRKYEKNAEFPVPVVPKIE